jgi:hypothetical protein
MTATTSTPPAVDRTETESGRTLLPAPYSGSHVGDPRVIGWAVALTVAVPLTGALALAVAGPPAAVLALLAALAVACLADTRWGPEERDPYRMVGTVPTARRALAPPPVTVTAVATDLPRPVRALTSTVVAERPSR